MLRSTFSPDLEAPVPLYAEVIHPGGTWRVVFNKTVRPGALNAANWFVTHNLDNYAIITALAADRQVRLTGFSLGAFSPPEGISYSPPPADLYGTNGLPVAAFVKIPFV